MVELGDKRATTLADVCYSGLVTTIPLASQAQAHGNSDSPHICDAP